jgi:hypothetical protein
MRDNNNLTFYAGNMLIPPEIAEPATPLTYQPLTPAAAINMLPEGNTIHINTQDDRGGIVGMDADPLEIAFMLATLPLQASGPIATYAGHGLAIGTDPIIFVATKYPPLPQELYRELPARCPLCKTALETQTIPHADATTNHLRQLCTNCGAQWWHDKPANTYSDLVDVSNNPLT